MTKRDKTLANRLNFLLEAKALTDSVGKFSANELGYVHSVGKFFVTICHKEKIFGFVSKSKKDGSKYIKDTYPNIELVKNAGVFHQKTDMFRGLNLQT